METRLVAEAMRRLYHKGLIELKGGNVSVRVDIGGVGFILITPSGVEKDRVDPDSIAVVSLDDGSIVYGRPSSEYRLHLEIYRRIGRARAVVHAHNPLATVLVEAGLPLEPFAGEAFKTCITRVEYHPAGTEELAKAVASKLADTGCSVAIMERHGVVAVGFAPNPEDALSEALELVEAVELAARRALATLAAAPLLLHKG